MQLKSMGFLAIFVLIALIFLASCGRNALIEEGELPPEYEPSPVSSFEETPGAAETIPVPVVETIPVPVFELGEVVFTDEPPRSGTEREVTYWSDGVRAEHGFYGVMLEENTDKLHRAEVILFVASEIYNLPTNRVRRIYHDPVGSETRISYPNSNNIVLGGGGEIGVLFSQLSGGQFPAWLCVGLELYWLDRHDIETPGINRSIDVTRWQADAFARDLPEFGDVWFIPGLISDDLREEALSVAYTFVRHLNETGELDRLVALFRGNNVWEAEESRAILWAGFAGMDTPGVHDRVFVYAYNPVHRVEGSPRSPFSVGFTVRGRYAIYHFGYEAGGVRPDWTLDMANHHFNIGEESIRFVSDWLYHEPDGRFVVYNITVEGPGGGGYANRIITNFQDILDPPWAMTHEAVHAVVSAERITSNIPATVVASGPGWTTSICHIEEGLCLLIEMLFEIETQNERFALEAAGHRRGYHRFLGNFEEQTTRLTIEEAAGYINRRALVTLEYFDFDTGRFFFDETWTWIGARYPVLHSNCTAGSFLFYLYAHRGSREDLLRVYSNTLLMYEVYGYTMYEMLDQWLEHLEQYQ